MYLFVRPIILSCKKAIERHLLRHGFNTGAGVRAPFSRWIFVSSPVCRASGVERTLDRGIGRLRNLVHLLRHASAR